MNLEPQKFFIGLIDFFSILLPGALMTYMLMDEMGPFLIGVDAYGSLAGAKGWAAFLFASYLLGHFIFLIGSSLLDDHVYDKIRKATRKNQIGDLARGEALAPQRIRRLASRFFKEKADHALDRVLKIKESYLAPLYADPAINAFQWSKARLTLEKPGALETVQRFEVDSKFFRSLFVVLCALIPWNLAVGDWAIALATIPLLLLALWRYIDRRSKSVMQAYWYVITLEASRKDGFREEAETLVDGFTHAGGVVFRRSGDGAEYLLVQAKNKPQEWVLPKGHIETGEPMRETAVREVLEEAGVWARVIGDLDEISFSVSGDSVSVKFFLMEALEEEKAKPSDERKREWLTFEAALDRAKHDQTKDLLRLAERKMIAP